MIISLIQKYFKEKIRTSVSMLDFQVQSHIPNPCIYVCTHIHIRVYSLQEILLELHDLKGAGQSWSIPKSFS